MLIQILVYVNWVLVFIKYLSLITYSALCHQAVKCMFLLPKLYVRKLYSEFTYPHSLLK